MTSKKATEYTYKGATYDVNGIVKQVIETHNTSGILALRDMKIRVKFANGKRRTITGVDVLHRLHQANAVRYGPVTD